MHGGSAPQVLAAARVRLQMAANKAAKTIETIMADTSVSASDRLKAAQMVLDRAGIPAKAELEVGVTLKPWEQVLSDGIAFTEDDGTEVVVDRHDYSHLKNPDVVHGDVLSEDRVGEDDRDPNGEW